ncbi:hypothetical protein SmJEL517_g06004 [Synchytrium microbalum]|uniref:Acetyl-coenzyme A transporter 1 n=1 Tax=Synchytrium microbalum TaxID=1806994 RepID=A0A507BYT2_9FUNG|nr:uncharacterized protein SmJEL517_g06004 [Synchytrium microbalum]TPX30433.1 hypothetical protein SmJEL517_g06004 [Synchytrium microbalum]
MSEGTRSPISTKKITLADDLPQLVLLICLYLLQGIPLGLAFGSIQFLLKQNPNVSYSDLALFSLASYPYSLKLFWSPVVDSIYFKSIGRRKSWIVPIQAITGITLFILGSKIDGLLAQEVLPVRALAGSFFFIVLLCATQDIAVDGWALTLLREENKAYASTGKSLEFSVSSVILSLTPETLSANNRNEYNKYLRSTPSELGLFQLGPYIQFWALAFLACDLWLIFVQKESPSHEPSGWHEIRIVYRQIFSIIMLPQMQRFIAVMMVAKLGFIASESVTGLKLLEKGFKKEDLALAVLIDFPFEILFGYYAAKWSSGSRPLRPWLYAFYGRLASALLAMVLVALVPASGITTTFFVIVMASTVLGSFMSTVQFVGMGSFFTRISDPSIGGTYMTLLNTVSNFGGTWPRYFILNAVDYFTDSTCSETDSGNSTIHCSSEPSKALCKTMNGTCQTRVDGYYVVGLTMFVIGVVCLLTLVKPVILNIESLPDRNWRVVKFKEDDDGDNNRYGDENVRLIDQ